MTGVLVYDVFDAAKRMPRSGICKSYGRQIGTALLMYASDYDERLPAHVITVGGQHRTLPVRLDAYLRNGEVWRCPDAPRERTFGGDPGDTTVSHGYNWLALEEAGRGLKLSALKQPERTVAFAETTSYLAAPPPLTGAVGTAPLYAHREKATVVWLDGHVKALTREELERTSSTAHGRAPKTGIDAYEFWNRN
jgi:prepilin-type processing-associated H-X9-DG protein